MKTSTLLVIPILLVMVIMVCVVNRGYQEETLDQTVNYFGKSSVTQNIPNKYLNTSNGVHSHFPEQETSDKNTLKIIPRRNKESPNCYSGNKGILHTLNNQLMVDEKTSTSNLIVEPPVEELQQRICSSLSYISPCYSFGELSRIWEHLDQTYVTTGNRQVFNCPENINH